MKKLTILILTVFVIQICVSASVEDAESKLSELRELTKKKVDEAFKEHSKMSKEVDLTAAQTKQKGLEEINKKTEKFLAKLKSDKALKYKCRGSRDHIYGLVKQQHLKELIRCVDQEGTHSVNVLQNQRLHLVEYVWNAIYAKEKHIINCGNNSECLASAIANISDEISEVERVINDEVDISKNNKEVQIQAIKGCGSRSVANVEHALGKVPTCSY